MCGVLCHTINAGADMTEARIGRHKAKMYDGISELPVSRFHVYNKFLLVDAGIGSDVSDLDAHLEKAIMYLRESNTKDAVQELENLRQNVFFITQNISPKHLSFAALLIEVDGVKCDDISEDGLKRTLQLINDAPIEELTALHDAVKKKINDELVTFFPALFDDPRVKEYHENLRARTIAILNGIIHGDSEQRADEIGKYTERLMQANKPRKFDGSNGFEVQYEKQFEKMCLTISQNLHTDPHGYTVAQFYNAYEYIMELSKSLKKHG